MPCYRCRRDIAVSPLHYRTSFFCDFKSESPCGARARWIGHLSPIHFVIDLLRIGVTRLRRRRAVNELRNCSNCEAPDNENGERVFAPLLLDFLDSSLKHGCFSFPHYRVRIKCEKRKHVCARSSCWIIPPSVVLSFLRSSP